MSIWLAVDKKGAERICNGKPERGIWTWIDKDFYCGFVLPKGTILTLIGRKLTWKDNPVRLTRSKLLNQTI